MTDIATAYVRLRPNTAGFQQEAEAQVKGIGTSAGKLFAVAFGAAAIGTLGEKTISAAISQTQAISQVRQLTKQAGADWVVYGKSVKENLVDLADQSGFTVEQLAEAFSRLQPSVKDTAKTLDLLTSSTEVARGSGRDLTTVSTALAKAQAGQTTGLTRLGIVTKAYTGAQDLVKAKLLEIAHAETAVSEAKAKHYEGTIKLTDSERALAALTAPQRRQLLDSLKAQLDAAKATDKQTTAQRGLDEVTARFKGQNPIFAASAAGQIARFHEAINELEVTIGTGLLPTLSSAATTGREWAQELARSGDVASVVKGTMQGVSGAVQSIGTAFQASRPALQLFLQLSEAIGPGPILAAATAYYALTKAQALAAVVGGKYDALVKAGVVVQEARIAALAEQAAVEATAAAVRAASAEADALALQVETVGLSERTVAAMAAVDATIADTEALLANGLALGEVSAANAAATISTEVNTVALGEQAAALGGMRAAGLGLLGVLTGPTAIIAATAALAGGLYYLSTRTSETEHHVDDLTDAMRRQIDAAHDARTALEARQADTNALPGQRDLRATTLEDIAKAQATYDQAAGSGHATRLELAQDARDIAIAQARWRDSNRQVTQTERDKVTQLDKVKQAHKDEAQAARDAVAAALALVPKEQVAGRFGSAPIVDLSAVKAAYNDLNRSADDASKHLTDDQRARLRELADKILELRRAPTQVEVDLILNTKPAEQALAGFKGSLLGAATFADSLLPKLTPPARGDHSTTVVVKNDQKKNKGLGKEAAQAFTTSFVQTIDAGDISKALVDAVSQARDQLSSQASGLAGAIGDTLDARLAVSVKKLDAASKQIQDRIDAREAAASARSTSQGAADAALKLKELQDELGPGALTADQALQLQAAKNAVLDAADAVATATDQHQADAISARKTALEQRETLEKTAANRRIADLTDELNRGLITQAQYVKGVRAELGKEQISYKSTGALLGKAFADGFRDSLAGVTAQAKALGALDPSLLKRTPTSQKAVDPAKAEADAIQAFIDAVAQSGGHFNVKNAGSLPKGVNLSGLLSAAGAQRAEAAYREKTTSQADTAIHFAGETRDHAKAILDELRKPKPVHVTVVVDDSAKKRKIAQATK